MIRVRAIKPGWHKNMRRKPKDEFYLEDIKCGEKVIPAEKQFSSKWMEKVEKPEAPKKRGRPKKTEDE